MRIHFSSTLPKNILSDIAQAVIKWLKTLWFESKTKARLKRIEWDNTRDYYWDLNEDFEPIYREEGKAMRLTAKHHKSYETEDELMEAYRQSD